MIQKAIIIQQSTDTVALALVVNVPVEDVVILRNFDEILFQVRRVLRIQFPIIFSGQVLRILFLAEPGLQLPHEARDLRQQVHLLVQELVLTNEFLHLLHARHVQQQLEVLHDIRLLLCRAVHLVVRVFARHLLLNLVLETADREAEELLEVGQVTLQLGEYLQFRLLGRALVQALVLVSVECHFPTESLDLIFITYNLNQLIILALVHSLQLHFLELENLLFHTPLVKLHVLVEFPLRIDEHELKVPLQLRDEFLRLYL